MSNADEPPDELARRRKQREENGAAEKSPEPPKTQSEPEKGWSGRGPRPPRRTAVGYSGDWGGRWGYNAGQNVICKVVRAEPGGYAVTIIKDNLPGFLPTQAILRTGEDVLAQFVCVHNNRILLSARFSNNISKSPTAHQQVRWEEQLDRIDAAQTPSGPNSKNSLLKSQNESQTREDPTALSPPQIPEEETAFAAWASATTPTREFRLKRATDLFLPPVESDACENFMIAEGSLESLIAAIESDRVTGCVKVSSDERRSRAAMLLYRGRVVGCVHVCRSMPETASSEQALKQMLADLRLPHTTVTKYDLPEDVTLAMSALFLGYPVQRNDDYDARAYMDYICNWFEGKQQTACLAFTLPSSASTCLGFVYKGKFCGAFYVEDQRFSRDRQFVYELLRRDQQAAVEATILPPEMTSSAVRFGYSLSQAAISRGR